MNPAKENQTMKLTSASPQTTEAMRPTKMTALKDTTITGDANIHLIGQQVFLNNMDTTTLAEQIAKNLELQHAFDNYKHPKGVSKINVINNTGVRTLLTLSNNRFVSGNLDTTLKIWYEQGKGFECQQTLDDHTGEVRALAILPDGRFISGSLDQTIKIWCEQEQGFECQQTLKGHKGTIFSLATFSNGWFVSGDVEGIIKVWQEKEESFECWQTFKDHQREVRALAILSDGRFISGSLDKTIKVWGKQGRGFECQQTLKSHTGGIVAFGTLLDGRIISGSLDQTMKVWCEKGKGFECQQTLRGHTDSVLALITLLDGRLLSAGGDAAINIWSDQGKGFERQGAKPFEKGSFQTWSIISLSDARLISGEAGYEGGFLKVRYLPPQWKFSLRNLVDLTEHRNLAFQISQVAHVSGRLGYEIFKDVLEKELLPYCQRHGSLQSKNSKLAMFVIYALPNVEHLEYKKTYIEDKVNQMSVKKLTKDLERLGIIVRLAFRNSAQSKSLVDFITDLDKSDYVLTCGSRLYLKKYNRCAKDLNDREDVVRLESQLLNHMTRYSQNKSESTLSVLLAGSIEESLPQPMYDKLGLQGDFARGNYFEEFFKLVATIYKLDIKDKRYEKIQRDFFNTLTRLSKVNIAQLEGQLKLRKSRRAVAKREQLKVKNIQQSYQNDTPLALTHQVDSSGLAVRPVQKVNEDNKPDSKLKNISENIEDKERKDSGPSLQVSSQVDDTISSSESTVTPIAHTEAPLNSRLKTYCELMALEEDLEITPHELNNPIGTGAFGIVYRGLFNGGNAAIKCIKTVAETHADYYRNMEQFQREIQCWAKTKHERIVKLYSIGFFRQQLTIVMELMDCSLHDALYQQNENNQFTYQLNKQNRHQIALDICIGLKYLHSKDLVHRDIKSENILLDEHFRAKICDFGLSRALEGTLATITTDGRNSKGTPTHMAPEVCRSDPGCYTVSCDIYSYGVVVMEIVTRTRPFEDKKDWNNVQLCMQIGFRGARPTLPDTLSSEISEFIENCWHSDLGQRLTINQAFDQLPAKEYFPDDGVYPHKNPT